MKSKIFRISALFSLVFTVQVLRFVEFDNLNTFKDKNNKSTNEDRKNPFINENLSQFVDSTFYSIISLEIKENELIPQLNFNDGWAFNYHFNLEYYQYKENGGLRLDFNKPTHISRENFQFIEWVRGIVIDKTDMDSLLPKENEFSDFDYIKLKKYLLAKKYCTSKKIILSFVIQLINFQLVTAQLKLKWTIKLLFFL